MLTLLKLREEAIAVRNKLSKNDEYERIIALNHMIEDCRVQLFHEIKQFFLKHSFSGKNLSELTIDELLKYQTLYDKTTEQFAPVLHSDHGYDFILNRAKEYIFNAAPDFDLNENTISLSLSDDNELFLLAYENAFCNEMDHIDLYLPLDLFLSTFEKEH